MSNGIFRLLYDIIINLSSYTVDLIGDIFFNIGNGDYLYEIMVNLSLFSETPIISMDLYQLLVLFFTIFYSMFFIILLYKAIKKFINMIFGVFKI